MTRTSRTRPRRGEGQPVVYARTPEPLDYLVEAARAGRQRHPAPLIAAGINLFRAARSASSTSTSRRGADPPRHKDPIYLTTLRLRRRTAPRPRPVLLSRAGAATSGRMKRTRRGPPRRRTVGREERAAHPAAIAYDVVLEDRAIASQAVKKTPAPTSRTSWRRWSAWLRLPFAGVRDVRAPIALGRTILTRARTRELAHLTRGTIGRLYKVPRRHCRQRCGRRSRAPNWRRRRCGAGICCRAAGAKPCRARRGARCLRTASSPPRARASSRRRGPPPAVREPQTCCATTPARSPPAAGVILH